MKTKLGKSVKVIGKSRNTFETLLLKSQAFLVSKKFRVTELHSRSVHAVAFGMRFGFKVGKVYTADEVLKTNTTYLRIFGSDTRKAIALYSGLKVHKVTESLKDGNDNLCFKIRLSK